MKTQFLLIGPPTLLFQELLMALEPAPDLIILMHQPPQPEPLTLDPRLDLIPLIQEIQPMDPDPLLKELRTDQNQLLMKIHQLEYQMKIQKLEYQAMEYQAKRIAWKPKPIWSQKPIRKLPKRTLTKRTWPPIRMMNIRSGSGRRP